MKLLYEMKIRTCQKVRINITKGNRIFGKTNDVLPRVNRDFESEKSMFECQETKLSSEEGKFRGVLQNLQKGNHTLAPPENVFSSRQTYVARSRSSKSISAVKLTPSASMFCRPLDS